jgi:protein SERAC1
MGSDFTFQKVCGDNDAFIDILFMHGLTGDAKETWSTEDGKIFWPQWLQEDLNYCSISTIGYPASLFEKWAKKEMDIFERAGNILEYMAAKGIGENPTVIVAHSLGGILAKVLLRKANESEDPAFKKIAESSRLVIFVATPHYGAALAAVLNVLPKASKHIALLNNEIGFLEDLNFFYRSFANGKQNLETAVYYEKYRTKNLINVVSQQSADPGVAGAAPIALDKDHINICKPVDRDDIFYLGIRRRIKKIHDNIIENSPRGSMDFLGVDYSEKSISDRRDLLEKLVDANREHEYEFANNAQNEFARSFQKTGLFTTARNDHESLLSEVETRFVTHVYHPLICTGKDDETISEALQLKIIDTLAHKKIGDSKFPAKAIVSALYYLTEQCHIKWDYEV